MQDANQPTNQQTGELVKIDLSTVGASIAALKNKPGFALPEVGQRAKPRKSMDPETIAKAAAASAVMGSPQIIKRVRRTHAREQDKAMPIVSSEAFPFDVATSEGRKQRFIAIINSTTSKDADVIRAIKELEALYNAEADPDGKIDPAQVCGYLARCQLHGDDPGKVLLKKRGLKVVAQALLDSLGLDAVRLVLDGETVDTVADNQCLQGVATDLESVAVAGGGGA